MLLPNLGGEAFCLRLESAAHEASPLRFERQRGSGISSSNTVSSRSAGGVKVFAAREMKRDLFVRRGEALNRSRTMPAILSAAPWGGPDLP